MKSSTDIFLGLLSKRSILQLYKTTTFLAQLRMVSPNHSGENQIITHQIPEEKLKQLGL